MNFSASDQLKDTDTHTIKGELAQPWQIHVCRAPGVYDFEHFTQPVYITLVFAFQYRVGILTLAEVEAQVSIARCTCALF